MNWEEIDSYRRRCRVPWGWVYECTEPVCHNLFKEGRGMESGWDFRIAACFVFDPFHWWLRKEKT
jgi:hypothetical protein